MSVKEAARLLATSDHAIRQRLYRGTLDSEKDERGNVVVLVPEHLVSTTADSQDEGERDTQEESATSALITELRDKNRILEEQLREANESNRENRRLLAALTQRIPELEAPSETQRSPQTTSEGAGRVTATPEQHEPSQRRSWWRAFFGLE